jgi:hypothetical protein
MKKAMSHLIRVSFPKYTSECGNCAKFVRIAVEKELGKPVNSTLSAKDYGVSYEKLGFKKVFSFPNQPKEQYKPIHGDIAIIQYNPHGHICMFCFGLDPATGKPYEGWISDFKQRDMYGSKIRDKNPNFDIYRYDVA